MQISNIQGNFQTPVLKYHDTLSTLSYASEYIFQKTTKIVCKL